ncbi:MAG: FAD:protein FMN transferase, partial [Thermoanaerobaculales bacterium]|nr:FAD:protein FMN transferase [Thermoanaerobaculales bacterium]
PWRIGVERPEHERGSVWSAVELVDAAMATSGDYRNYYERDGLRISHMIDPRTGRPIRHSLASVSVIHPICMTADALATALSVLGPEDGRELVERQGLAALFIVRSANGGFVEWQSPAWPGGNSLEDGDVAVTESF